jgi:hypothetical protein
MPQMAEYKQVEVISTTRRDRQSSIHQYENSLVLWSDRWSYDQEMTGNPWNSSV